MSWGTNQSIKLRGPRFPADLSTCRQDKRVQWMLRCLGQWHQSLYHEQECSKEGEGAASLQTSRQGSPSSCQLHTSVLSTFYQGKKKIRLPSRVLAAC